MLCQKSERLPIERGHVLVQWRVRAILEYIQLGIANAALQRVGEPGGGNHVVAPECYLCRSADLAELRFGVVADGRIGLLDERIDGLFGAAAHEVGQGLDVIRFLRIQFRREAPWEDALN